MSDAKPDKVTETIPGQKVTPPTNEEIYGEADKAVANWPAGADEASTVMAAEALPEDKKLK